MGLARSSLTVARLECLAMPCSGGGAVMVIRRGSRPQSGETRTYERFTGKSQRRNWLPAGFVKGMITSFVAKAFEMTETGPRQPLQCGVERFVVLARRDQGPKPVIESTLTGSRLRGDRSRDELPQRPLRLLAIVLVDVDHERRDRPMPTERTDLVEAQACPLPELRRVRDGRPSRFLPRFPRVRNSGPATGPRCVSSGVRRQSP